MAEAKYEEDDETISKKPVMQKVTATLGRNFARSKEFTVR